MQINPDTKDWTWVLTRPCSECSFDASRHDRDCTATMIRSNARSWGAALVADGAGERRDPYLWSALEYGCHVRDVYSIYNKRVRRMLHENGPSYDNWDQDETAVLDDYAAQNPQAVAQQLIDVAGSIASTFEQVAAPETWLRTGHRSDGASFTVESISRYMLHDVIHHLVDIGISPADAGATTARP